MYIPVKVKVGLSILFSFGWVAIAFVLGMPWLGDLTVLFGPILAWVIITGVAFLPGLMNSLIVMALILDKRPQYFDKEVTDDISVLIAAYNEESVICDTLESIVKQEYAGTVDVYVVDDGSTDNTITNAQTWIKTADYNTAKYRIHLLKMPKNGGKAAALNLGLTHITSDYVVALDADTYLYKDALHNIMANIVYGPSNTAAVAGTILVRNSRTNFLTKLQEWDYFQGIGVVKRTQSLFQGTLVAQGAFSVYRTDVLHELGGWDETAVGEDIVLTWGMREKNYRVGYAENAFSFTNVPENYKQFFNQRKRWSRGLIEAFKKYPRVLTRLKTNSPFIYINLFFPFTDAIFVFVFMPSLIAAVFFQWYAIVSMMTVMLLPMALIMNWLMFKKQKFIFEQHGLKVRKNVLGLLVYMTAYQLVMVPATFLGYWQEILMLGKKNWGTK